MGNKKILLRGIVIVLIGVIVLLLNYIQYVQYTEGLRQDFRKLENYYRGYSMAVDSFIVPKNKEDVEKMFSWQKKMRDKDLKLKFLKYGYNIKYDKYSDTSIIYCFGQNKKDDKLIDCNGNAITLFRFAEEVVTLDFFTYYFNTKNDDIEIFRLKSCNQYKSSKLENHVSKKREIVFLKKKSIKNKIEKIIKNNSLCDDKQWTILYRKKKDIEQFQVSQIRKPLQLYDNRIEFFTVIDSKIVLITLLKNTTGLFNHSGYFIELENEFDSLIPFDDSSPIWIISNENVKQVKEKTCN